MKVINALLALFASYVDMSAARSSTRIGVINDD